MLRTIRGDLGIEEGVTCANRVSFFRESKSYIWDLNPKYDTVYWCDGKAVLFGRSPDALKEIL